MTSETDRFTVQIQSGLYAGVAETLPAGRYIVGSSIEADIVLVDDGLAPQHFAVDTLGPTIRIEALADAVTVEGVATLNAGEARTLPLPLEIRIGAVRLTWLSAAAGPGETPAGALRVPLVGAFLSRHVWAVAAVLIACGIFVVPNPMADASVGGQRGLSAGLTDPTGSAAAPTPAPSPPRADAAKAPQQLPTKIELKSGLKGASAVKPGAKRNGGEAAAEALRAEIEKAGLLNVSVVPGTGVVTATGSVEPGATSRWQAAQQWFDERFGGEVTLVNGVSVKTDKLPVSLAIEAVWRGQHPHLIIRGQKFLEGALLEGGWAIQKIEGERVLLQREGRLVAVKY